MGRKLRRVDVGVGIHAAIGARVNVQETLEIHVRETLAILWRDFGWTLNDFWVELDKLGRVLARLWSTFGQIGKPLSNKFKDVDIFQYFDTRLGKFL